MGQQIWSSGIGFIYHVIIRNRISLHQIKHQWFVIQRCQWLTFRRHFYHGVHLEKNLTDGPQNSIYSQRPVRQKICPNIQKYWNSRKLKIQMCRGPVKIIRWWQLVSFFSFVKISYIKNPTGSETENTPATSTPRSHLIREVSFDHEYQEYPSTPNLKREKALVITSPDLDMIREASEGSAYGLSRSNTGTTPKSDRVGIKSLTIKVYSKNCEKSLAYECNNSNSDKAITMITLILFLQVSPYLYKSANIN